MPDRMKETGKYKQQRIGQHPSHAVGLAGEFLVAAGMALRGWQVVHTPRGHTGFDLLAHRRGRVVGVRVKAAGDPTIKWTAKGRTLLAQYRRGNSADFTAMVLFERKAARKKSNQGRVRDAQIYIVPTDLVVAAVVRDDKFYHRHRNRDGSDRKVTNLRVMRFSGYDRPTNTAYGYQHKFARYLGNWDLRSYRRS